VAIAVYKPPCWTPLDAIRALRERDASLRDARLAYAGRLDPMAEGVLLLLEGDENRDAASFRALDKEYRVRVLFGFATDTDDALGCVMASDPSPRVATDAFDECVRASVGTFAQPMPAYSAARVRGRPLYWWARAGRIDEVRAPVFMRTIHAATVRSTGEIEAPALMAHIRERVSAVRGDFRQAAILEAWTRALATASGSLPWATIDVHCSSGTFMRSYARSLGEALGTRAIALEIVRERVGPYRASDARVVLT
jgi:tRNA pseudouridine55 synthase